MGDLDPMRTFNVSDPGFDAAFTAFLNERRGSPAEVDIPVCPHLAIYHTVFCDTLHRTVTSLSNLASLNTCLDCITFVPQHGMDIIYKCVTSEGEATYGNCSLLHRVYD